MLSWGLNLTTGGLMAICPKCSSEKCVKDGIIKGKQRYRCKSCDFRHTVQHRGKTPDVKRQALELYLEGLGFRSIDRFLKCSHVAVYKLWTVLQDKEIEQAMTDFRKPYKHFVPNDKHMQSKAETYTVEGYNSLFRHFLARLRRKTKCYSIPSCF